MIITILLILVVGLLHGAMWRRIKGGGWWPADQGPWWAADGLVYVWLFVPLALALYALGTSWWAAPGMALLQCLLWNPGHSGLAMGRQPGEPERARKKPLARVVMPLANLLATPDSAAWCGWLLSLDYAIRTVVVGAVGAYVIGPWFGVYAAAGLLTGPIYALGWAIYDRGWRPFFTQPPHRDDGHLFGECINGGWLQATFLAAVVLALKL